MSNITNNSDANRRVEKAGFALENAVLAFAGFMVLLSVALTYWVNPLFIWLTVFVGANMFQSAFTGFCPAAMVIRKVFGLRSLSEMNTK